MRKLHNHNRTIKSMFKSKGIADQNNEAMGHWSNKQSYNKSMLSLAKESTAICLGITIVIFWHDYYILTTLLYPTCNTYLGNDTWISTDMNELPYNNTFGYQLNVTIKSVNKSMDTQPKSQS